MLLATSRRRFPHKSTQRIPFYSGTMCSSLLEFLVPGPRAGRVDARRLLHCGSRAWGLAALLDLRFLATFFVACLAFTLALLFTAPAAQAQELRIDAPRALEVQSGGARGIAPGLSSASAFDPTTSQAPVQRASGPSAPAQEQLAAPAPEPLTSEPVQDQVSAPVQDRAAPSQQQTAPVPGQAMELVAGKTTNPGLGTVQEKVEPTAAPVMEPVGQTAVTAIHTTKQAMQPVRRTVEPVRQTKKPVVAAVKEKRVPVLDTTNKAADQVVQPVKQRVEPPAKPVLNTVWKSAEPPVVDTGERTAEPVHRTVDPLTGPVREAANSIAAPAVALLVSPPQKPAASLREGNGRLVAEPVPAPATDSHVDQPPSEVPSRAPLPFSPDNLPATPAPANSLDGLGASSGGFFLGFGILTLLCVLSAFGGRLLRSSCEFLRPSSALRLALERPG
jgi:hypothetical protein